jgi:phosphoribosylglycinamide formyltransferase 1
VNSKPLRLVLLASGNGSNAENLMSYAREHDDVEVVGLLSDNPEAFALQRAQRNQVPTAVVSAKGKSAQIREAEMIEQINHWKADWLCLCGYMRLLSQDFLSKFPLESTGLSRVLNIHPALLPAFPGLDGYGQAFDAGVKLAGATVHLVDAGMDTGPIVLQKAFERRDHDSLETFKARGLEHEYQLYREALDLIRHGRLQPQKKGSSWYVCTHSTT